MQRAAASTNRTPSSTTSTPTHDSNGLPSTKRQKLTDSEPSTPGTPTALSTPHSSDLRAISAALAAEEKSRAEARARSAAEGGETEWVLNIQVPGVNGHVNGGGKGANGAVEASLAGHEVESEKEHDEIWDNSPVGRRSYGDFKRRKAQTQNISTQSGGAANDEGLSELDLPDSDEGEDGELQHDDFGVRSTGKGSAGSDVRHEKKRKGKQRTSDADNEVRNRAMDRWSLKTGKHKMTSISGFARKSGGRDPGRQNPQKPY